MQLKIDLPDVLPDEKVSFLIKEIEDIILKEGIEFNIFKEANKAASYSFSLRGKPFQYNDPFEGVAEDEWEVLE